LQVRFEQPSALFSIHLEAVTADGNTCRISIGNIFKAENIKVSQLPCPSSKCMHTLLILTTKSRVLACHLSFAVAAVRCLEPQVVNAEACALPFCYIMQRKAGCMQYTLKDPPSCWMLLSVDLAAAVAAAAACSSSSSNTQPSSLYSHLKGLQLCSTLTVRGAFTSDIRFGLQVGMASASTQQRLRGASIT
jgi:hypothetical protein